MGQCHVMIRNNFVDVIADWRSNPGPNITMEDLCNKLESFEVFKNDISEIKKSVNCVTVSIVKVSKDISDLKSKINFLKSENVELRKKRTFWKIILEDQT